MGQVTIDSVVYDVYGELTGAGSATEYHAASLSEASVTWRALATDDKARTLVMAARVLNRQSWAGAKTDPEQPLAWPRTGVTYPDGTAVDDATIPPEIIAASYELAALVAADASIAEAGTASSNIRSLQAGSASIEYFAPQVVGRFPPTLMELVGFWLAGRGGTLTSAIVSGADGDSSFDDCDADNLTGAL